MAKYLISFPAAAMVVRDVELKRASRDSHAVIDAAKAAGGYVFGGGIDAGVPVVCVSGDGTVAEGGYPSGLNSTVDSRCSSFRQAALAWAARLATTCRCDQELRVLHFDPAS